MNATQPEANPEFPLSIDETIIKKVSVQYWDAYLTSQRILLFHDIGFGAKAKILDVNSSDLESVEEKQDVPWGLYGIGGLFVTIFFVAMTVWRNLNYLEGAPLFTYFATPLFFIIGIFIVGQAFFKPINLVIKVKNSPRPILTSISLKEFFDDLSKGTQVS